MDSEGLINSFFIFMDDGGVFMWIIFGLWILGLTISLERLLNFIRFDVDGPSMLNEVQKYVISNDLSGAIKLCSDSKAFIPRIFKNGLKRASQTVEQIQNSIDATALECIGKVERRVGYVSLLANISTLMGLLGTIYGLIESFEAVGAADPSKKAEILASGISKAMNTTAMGLISAISLMAIHSLLTAKQEKIISEMDEYSIKLLDLLGTRKFSSKKN